MSAAEEEGLTLLDPPLSPKSIKLTSTNKR